MEHARPNDLLLVLRGLPQRRGQRDLHEALQLQVREARDRVVERAVQPQQQHLQTFDHRHHLHQRRLLLAAQVVPNGLQRTDEFARSDTVGKI